MQNKIQLLQYRNHHHHYHDISITRSSLPRSVRLCMSVVKSSSAKYITSALPIRKVCCIRKVAMQCLGFVLRADTSLYMCNLHRQLEQAYNHDSSMLCPRLRSFLHCREALPLFNSLKTAVTTHYTLIASAGCDKHGIGASNVSRS